ncbi:hypothetical protein LUZ63_016769 [Rhynchospora breviuscula]|uniref:Aminotransferase-like plant mobile domain-containing protein n=1 Tax=Rhynchospora breviuscula TaxID=2022672 RepID=A0A9P9ZAJ2_9POAL|nr:hypothetical protein LUZ63_016769 [Rhynchospora breviuscula]
MPLRRKVPKAPARRSTRLRGDAGTSISTGYVDADAVVPPGPVNADRLLHLDESKLRGTADVAFLYDLPTIGKTVTGQTNYDAIQLLQELALPQDKNTETDLHSSNSVQYNWGAVTLAMLYRGLDTAFINNNIQVGVPWLLLQLWSYARLLLSRPTITKNFDGWGLPNIDSCPPYERNWTTREKSKKMIGPTRSGLDYARDVRMKMRHEHVMWRPYNHIRDRMPRCAQPWLRMKQLIAYQHSTYRAIDWHEIFSTKVNKWANTAEVRVIEDPVWSENIWTDYRRWLRVPGGAHLVRIPEGTATGSVRDLSYLHKIPGHMNLVKHTLREALRVCAWTVTKGFCRAGKKLLRGCSTSLDIAGEPHRLPRLLESKGLHSYIDSIPDTDD